jgi:hypothetical protein
MHAQKIPLPRFDLAVLDSFLDSDLKLFHALLLLTENGDKTQRLYEKRF